MLATFIIAAVLRPFRGQRRIALHAESVRTAGLHSTLSQMFLDRWDKVFGRRLTTQQVSCLNKHHLGVRLLQLLYFSCWNLLGHSQHASELRSLHV